MEDVRISIDGGKTWVEVTCTQIELPSLGFTGVVGTGGSEPIGLVDPGLLQGKITWTGPFDVQLPSFYLDHEPVPEAPRAPWRPEKLRSLPLTRQEALEAAQRQPSVIRTLPNDMATWVEVDSEGIVRHVIARSPTREQLREAGPGFQEGIRGFDLEDDE